MEMNVLRVTAKAKCNDSIFRKHKNEFDYNLLNIFIYLLNLLEEGWFAKQEKGL
jgi:hypothetical protein